MIDERLKKGTDVPHPGLSVAIWREVRAAADQDHVVDIVNALGTYAKVRRVLTAKSMKKFRQVNRGRLPDPRWRGDRHYMQHAEQWRAAERAEREEAARRRQSLEREVAAVSH